MSFGVPVIVARSGALPELVEHATSGLIFDAGDHEALADCLRQVASDRSLLKRLHHGALARVKRYSPEAFAASLDAFVRKVCANATQGEFGKADKPAGGETPPESQRQAVSG
jgi:glycosyltransferase involved in cell wall biosynthesis